MFRRLSCTAIWYWWVTPGEWDGSISIYIEWIKFIQNASDSNLTPSTECRTVLYPEHWSNSTILLQLSSCYLVEFVIDNVSSSTVRNAPILPWFPIGQMSSPDWSADFWLEEEGCSIIINNWSKSNFIKKNLEIIFNCLLF